uniref:NADH-ubiquinone oxidoreductase chain 3 n=1 Tax=Fieberiella septentrionalis TaxID=1978376 RepID=A0A890CCI2_9HEMI|nr:NADH dehydrogenase subunit 3 [Fieberiella septentrionalis]QRG29282.1 NADH dehydrogenase subunit 3 [Fieberiella septentrionalis]
MKLTLEGSILILLLLLIMMVLISLISKKSIIDMQKSTPFECGFNPMSYSRLPFSTHFFLIAVIFLIFDIEIVLIMPVIANYKVVLINYWVKTLITFMLILIMGTYHEWNNGMLKWTN